MPEHSQHKAKLLNLLRRDNAQSWEVQESYVANKLKQLINKQISIKIQDESHRIFDKCEVGGNEEKNILLFLN